MSQKSARQMAKNMAKFLKPQKPNYDYLRDVFRYIRKELNIQVTTQVKRLPYVPTEAEIKIFYQKVWQSKDSKHILMIKVLLYTGIRVSELLKIQLIDIDLDRCQIRITKGKGQKDRVVPFPQSFKETLTVYISQQYKENRLYLFESSVRTHYSDRGIRKILAKYTKLAGITRSISPHKLRHFLFTWLKKQNIDDALIQPYSGHEKRESLEIYSRLSLSQAQDKYDEVINRFPV